MFKIFKENTVNYNSTVFSRQFSGNWNWSADKLRMSSKPTLS